MLRKLYDWVVHWSQTPYGNWALFLIAFIESSIFPIPPDVLLIALCVGRPSRAFHFALICSAGSVLGGIVGYGIGTWGMDMIGEPILNMYDPERVVFGKVQHWYNAYGFWGVLAAAVTPIPYKVFTIASGVFQFNFPTFLLASIIGRSLRFFLVGGLLWYGGERLKAWIERYLDILAWSALAAGILGFIAIKWF